MTQPEKQSWRTKQEWRLLLTLALLAISILGLGLLSHGSATVFRKSLAEFPLALASWNGVDVPIDDRVEVVLGATDLLNRVYVDKTQTATVGLFVGFFSSQRRGGAIHSPKNCLPGAGWSALQGDTLPISVPGQTNPIVVNRYTIQKDQQKQVVLYWYQSQGRVIASEYSAKVYLVLDAITRNRTDGALVRVISPVIGGDEAAALQHVKSFVQQTFPKLTNHIPS